MSADRNGEFFLCGLLLGALVSVPISIVVSNDAQLAFEAEAVKAGAGEWTITKAGVRAWKWTPAVGPVEK